MMAQVVTSAVLLLLCAIIANVSGHTYHTGSCPSVSPLPDFRMNSFLGIWYAIEKTSTASTCVVYNVTKGAEPGEFAIQQLSQHFVLGLTPLKHEYSYTGKLSCPDPDVPAKLRVRFPLSVAGDASYTIFATDYTSYAGIFSCQKIGFAHRRSATLLSRTRTLDKLYVDKMRSRLASFSVDPFDLSIINQTGCPKIETEDKGFNIDINPDTFSASNIAQGVRKAGEKLGDGVEVAINASKKVYTQLTKDDDNEDMDADNKPARNGQRSPVYLSGADDDKKDAEWIPF